MGKVKVTKISINLPHAHLHVSLLYLSMLCCISVVTNTSAGASSPLSSAGRTRSSIQENLQVYNQQLAFFKHTAADIAWNISVGPQDPSIWQINENFSLERNLWNNQWCQNLMALGYHPEYKKIISLQDARQIYLICRGPRFTSYQLSNLLAILKDLQTLYNEQEVFSMRMEPDLNKFMETSRDEELLKSAWIQWHSQIGTKAKPIYANLIQMLNQGARNAGHADMGETWRQELEIPNLKPLALKLYMEVKYLYSLLHSFVRFKLRQFYKVDSISINSTIPAHLLGSMWAQNWGSLLDMIFPQDEKTEKEGNGRSNNNNPLVKELVTSRVENATVMDLVQTAEEFFISMGFPHLPPKFYEKSYFTRDRKYPERNCHGSAANMFDNSDVLGDYRIMMCVKNNFDDEDLTTLAHEMGHIYYFMAYSHLDPIFQDGANSAFHESVGDSITYGLKSRKRQDKRSKMRDLLKIALEKLPQIGFGLVMDEWRWYVFENENSPETWNSYWWALHEEFLGIEPPQGYTTPGLDATGKFHIMDNVPYIRYFMASFIQLQLFDAYCQNYEDIHDCELRGNTMAGAKLWNLMRKGSSEHWSEVLKEMTGSAEILSAPLLKYFQPLQIWLEEQIELNQLTLGW